MRTFHTLANSFIVQSCLGLASADASPCTDQIAHIEDFMQQPKVSPLAQQAVVAQLHHQPTPQIVENAAGNARAEVDALLARAKVLDADGDAAECMNVISRLKILLGHGAAGMGGQLQSSEEAIRHEPPLRTGLER